MVDKRPIGERMVSAGLITEDQRDELLRRQRAEKMDDPMGKRLRFGEMAVEAGYCTQGEIESLPGFIGDKMLDAGLIDDRELKMLLTWQQDQRDKGENATHLGELAIEAGYCDNEDVDNILGKKKETQEF